MTDSSRSKIEQKIQKRLIKVAPLFKHGYTYRQIRTELLNDEELGMTTYSMDTIHKDIKRLLKEWQSERVKDTDAKIQLELSRIDDVIRTAWIEYNKTKDPRYLDIIHKQSIERRKLLGLYVEKIDVTSNNTSVVTHDYDLSKLDDITIIELANKLQDNKAQDNDKH